MNELSHCATCHVLAPAEFAFAYLSDPLKLGRWSLGCFATEPTDRPGVYAGVSLFDGGRGWYRIEAQPTTGAINFWVGTLTEMTHRISARVLPGGPLGYSSDTSLATLIAWRPAGMNDERWGRLRASHEAEIFLIKAQVEREFRGEVGAA